MLIYHNFRHTIAGRRFVLEVHKLSCLKQSLQKIEKMLLRATNLWLHRVISTPLRTAHLPEPGFTCSRRLPCRLQVGCIEVTADGASPLFRHDCLTPLDLTGDLVRCGESETMFLRVGLLHYVSGRRVEQCVRLSFEHRSGCDHQYGLCQNQYKWHRHLNKNPQTHTL
jgi:hypothetical protein